jgi:fucose 4-O-acetylase-like acetyltransferase
MSASGAGGRWHALDHVKAAAIVAVVVTHSGRVSLSGADSTADFVLTSLWTRFHVPSFLFASGFLYASRSPQPARTLGRRLRRVLFPYVVASLAVMLVGAAVTALAPQWTRWPTSIASFRDVAWQLATASALGIYYYIFLIVCCIPLAWPLSRSVPWGAWILCLVMAALALAIDAGLVTRPAWYAAERLGGGVVFWAMRDPFERFQMGYFLAGWLAALHLPALARFAARRRPLVLALCAAGLATGWASFCGVLLPSLQTAALVFYSLAVVSLLTLATRRRVAGPVVRFLGDASLGIYLIHRIFQLLAEPLSAGWPVPLRIATQVAVGLGGASLVLLAARRLLGEGRARQWLGA